MTRSIRVGTSGWLYPPWRGTFYPKGLVHGRELEYLSSTLTSVEINGTVANFLASGVLALGPKLGPILWQLPPSMRSDPDRLGPFLESLPRTTAAAAEVARRHDERLDGRDWCRSCGTRTSLSSSPTPHTSTR